MPYQSREVHLRRHIGGMPTPEDFTLVDTLVEDPGPGQMIVRIAYLGMDPFLRLYMGGARRNPVLYPLGAPPPGLGVGKVVASNLPQFDAGAWVVGPFGWREVALWDGAAGVRPYDISLGSPRLALGPLGMPGITAWAGTQFVAQPQAGEVLYVSSAAGAVGSIVGQIARLRGAHVVGSAGHPEKLAWLREVGFDRVFDYRRCDTGQVLAEAAPGGLDVAFDNVGGHQLGAIIENTRDFARIVCCGSISAYNEAGQSIGPSNLHLIFTRALTLRGFRWRDYLDRLPTFQHEMTGWLRSGAVKHREHVIEGIEQTPAAFASMFDSSVVGKFVVHVGPDDAKQPDQHNKEAL